MFHQISKHRLKKNSAAPRFFNLLLSVWISDETHLLVFDTLHSVRIFRYNETLFIPVRNSPRFDLSKQSICQLYIGDDSRFLLEAKHKFRKNLKAKQASIGESTFHNGIVFHKKKLIIKKKSREKTFSVTGYVKSMYRC